MHLTSYTDAAEFAARAEPFLLEREAENNIILGICSLLTQSPDPSRPASYLAVIEEDDQVVAAAACLPPNNLVLTPAKTDAHLALIADNLRDENFRDIPGVVGPKELSRTFADLWHRLEDTPYRLGLSMRCYQLEAVQHPTGVSGYLRPAEDRDRELLQQWLHGFHLEALAEVDPATPEQVARTVDRYLAPGHEALRGFMLWEDAGTVVSMAAYVGPTLHGMRVNSVYTPPGYRRHGYASACVAGVSQFILDSGKRFCFLFTDLKNPTSNKIYQDIGYHPVADVDEYLFGPSP